MSILVKPPAAPPLTDAAPQGNSPLEKVKSAVLEAAFAAAAERGKPQKEVDFPALEKMHGESEHFLVARKRDGSIVTSGDLRSQRLLEQRLPPLATAQFLGEESNVRDAGALLEKENCWVVDPVDGTRNYREDGREWGVTVALTKAGKPELAVVYVADDLESGTLYWAERGQGAYRQPVRGGKPTAEAEKITHDNQLYHNQFPVPKPMLLGLFPQDYLHGQYDGARRHGPVHDVMENAMRHATGREKVNSVSCACADALKVLSGEFAAYAHGVHYPWDDMAVSLVLEEGGVPVHTKTMGKSLHDRTMIVSANPQILEALATRHRLACRLHKPPSTVREH